MRTPSIGRHGHGMSRDSSFLLIYLKIQLERQTDLCACRKYISALSLFPVQEKCSLKNPTYVLNFVPRARVEYSQLRACVRVCVCVCLRVCWKLSCLVIQRSLVIMLRCQRVTSDVDNGEKRLTDHHQCLSQPFRLRVKDSVRCKVRMCIDLSLYCVVWALLL